MTTAATKQSLLFSLILLNYILFTMFAVSKQTRGYLADIFLLPVIPTPLLHQVIAICRERNDNPAVKVTMTGGRYHDIDFA